MIGQLDFVAVDCFFRKLANRGLGTVRSQRTLGENAQRQAVVVLLGERNQSWVSEHVFILR